MLPEPEDHPAVGFERSVDLSVPLDVPSQLEKLEAMRDRGTLTPEEFEAQKRRLLGS